MTSFSEHSSNLPSPASQSDRVLAVIPARYASTRFPGKPLVKIFGKPMIQHVWERVNQVPGIERAIVATDDPRIQEAVLAFGGEVVMTSPDHPSGTDRVWEVAQPLTEYSFVMNVQGDEPMIDPQALQKLIDKMHHHPEAEIATLIVPIRDAAEWQDPNIVKAVINQAGQALYFSRSPVPYHRDQPELPNNAFRHLGIYFFRRGALYRFTQLPPSPLELSERLEQLRALENGISIFTAQVSEAPIGIDTPEDLERLVQMSHPQIESLLT